MEIGVRVESHRGAVDALLHVASAYFVFVAVDEAGHSRPVPPLLTESEEDRRRKREAEIEREHRLAQRVAIEAGRTAGA